MLLINSILSDLCVLTFLLTSARPLPLPPCSLPLLCFASSSSSFAVDCSPVARLTIYRASTHPRACTCRNEHKTNKLGCDKRASGQHTRCQTTAGKPAARLASLPARLRPSDQPALLVKLKPQQRGGALGPATARGALQLPQAARAGAAQVLVFNLAAHAGLALGTLHQEHEAWAALLMRVASTHATHACMREQGSPAQPGLQAGGSCHCRLDLPPPRP